MAWDDFVACASQDGDILAELGEDTVRQLADKWDSLSDTAKAALGVAARWGGEWLAGALAAIGLVLSDAAIAVLAGASLGAVMAVIADCYDKL
jgi:hypothetical protein